MASCRNALRAAAVLLAVAGAAVVAPAEAPGAPAARIVVPRDVTVSRDPVRLRDVAILDGAAAEVIGDVVLGSAPGAGETRTFDGARLLETLHTAGLDTDTVVYSLPPLLRVRRESQDIGEPAVRTALADYLRTQLGDAAEDAELRGIELPGAIRVPAGVWTARVATPRGTALQGRVPFELTVWQEGRAVKTVWVAAEVARFGPVVVTTRAIARGEVLGPADLTIDRQDLTQLPQGVLHDLEGTTGMMARTGLLPHVPLRREQLGAPVVVRRGAVVLLVAQRGALRITAAGEVRQDAGRGDSVQVVNRGSGKTLVGRVLDESTVVVDF